MTKRAYQRISYQGQTLNRRTAAMIDQARDYLKHLKVDLPDLYQGSYNTSVGASAGTHAGGGAVDFKPPAKKRDLPKIIRALRLVGFIAWHRAELWQNGERVWPEHIHCIAVGDQEMSDAAHRQVQDYFAGRDGLASNGPDRAFRPHPFTVFHYPLPHVDLSNVRAQAQLGARSKKLKAMPGVKHIQRALNHKSGTHLVVDGIWGPKTRAAYAHWEKRHHGDGDGIPSMPKLLPLSLARFRIKP